MKIPFGKPILSNNEFKKIIEQDFIIHDDEKTITITKIKNAKWDVLEGHHKGQLSDVFQKVKNNYVDAVEKINTKQKEVELDRQKQRTDELIRYVFFVNNRPRCAIIRQVLTNV